MNLIVHLIFQLLVLAGFSSVLLRCWNRRRLLIPTTLYAAWKWGFCAQLFWWVVLALSIINEVLSKSILPTGTESHLWYGAAVLQLTPFVAVLGARRPTVNVWSMFVLSPMVIVIGWPVFIAWGTDQIQQPLLLETPACLAFSFVMLMGLGNYLGTRFSLAVCLVGLVLIGILSHSSQSMLFTSEISPKAIRIWGTILLTSAGFLASHLIANRRVCNVPEEQIDLEPGMNNSLSLKALCCQYNQLWFDVRDYYGIVWATRLMRDVNSMAEKESWPVRLSVMGLEPLNHSLELIEEELSKLDRQIEHRFRWLLQRFVTSEWIDERLLRTGTPDTDMPIPSPDRS